ncbi:MAG TPA: glycosyltransferase family 2 protein [Candidatus Hydrogenedentes bacterium]|nr:glycosyltransferase family 2 protein [Candidatus Hydrogenedentota bacterium]
MDKDNAYPEVAGLKSQVTVVIPCFNAGHRLKATLDRVCPLVDRVVLVDDGSTDGCTDGLEGYPVIKSVLPANRGKGYALIEGIHRALALPDTGAIALMDADGQHDPGDLPALFAVYRRHDADLVIGTRQLDRARTPWRSWFGNQVTAWVARKLLRCPLSDTQCGYRILSPRFAGAFVTTVSGGRYETEMEMILLAVNGGYTLLSAPVTTIYEAGNRSSHFRKVRDSLRIYTTLWRGLRNRNTAPRSRRRV